MTEYLQPVVPGGSEQDQTISQRAMELVTRSGFTQRSDASQSIPVEEVLVFLANRQTDWPGWTITNYRGRTIGHVIQSTTYSRPHHNLGKFSIQNAAGNEVLAVKPGRLGFNVEGITSGLFRRKKWPASLHIEVDGEFLGSIGSRARFFALNADVQSIWDHRGETVGQLKSYKASRIWFGKRKDHVLWRDPSLGTEFQKLLIAAPSVLTTIKKVEESVHTYYY